MNDDGFYYSNLGFIKWSDVTDIELLKKNNGKYIVFKMKKREAVREIVSFHSLGIYIDNVYTLGFCGTGINIEKVYMEMKKANEQKN